MVKRHSEDPKFYLSEVFKFVSKFPLVGEQVIIDEFWERDEKYKLEPEETRSLLRTLILGGFLYQPRPYLYARLLE